MIVYKSYFIPYFTPKTYKSFKREEIKSFAGIKIFAKSVQQHSGTQLYDQHRSRCSDIMQNKFQK